MSPAMTSTTEPSTGLSATSLNVSLKQSAPCQHQMQIRIAPEGMRPAHEAVMREFQREATIPGFRKGKAPRELLERKYAEEIREETLRRVTRQAFEQVAQERKLRPVGPFEVSKLEFDAEKGLSLEAQVEVEPEFSLADYRGIALRKAAVVVTPEERAQALQRLQESMAELVPAGEGQPKETRVPNLDDEFAKDLGFETLEALTTHVEAKLREQKSGEQAREMEIALCDQLLARHPFDVPPRLVAKQVERLTRDFQVRLLMAEYPEEQIKQELDKYQERLKTNAERHVKLAFILERIAEKEALSITQDEVIDRLWKLAKRSGKDPAEVRRLLDAQGLWPSVLSSIRQDKTIAFLVGVASVTEDAPLA